MTIPDGSNTLDEVQKYISQWKISYKNATMIEEHNKEFVRLDKRMNRLELLIWTFVIEHFILLIGIFYSISLNA